MDDLNTANDASGDPNAFGFEGFGEAWDAAVVVVDAIGDAVNGMGTIPGIGGQAPGTAPVGGTPAPSGGLVVGRVVRPDLLARDAGGSIRVPSSGGGAPDSSGLLTMVAIGGVVFGLVLVGGVLLLRPL